MNAQDQQVRKLWETAQQKKNEIEKIEKKSSWLTNCSFNYGNTTSSFNVQVVTDPAVFVEALAFLNVKKKSFDDAAKELDVSSSFTYLGFKVEDWKTDFATRIAKVTISKKRKVLEDLQTKLDKLLSPELKRQLELEEIEKALA